MTQNDKQYLSWISDDDLETSVEKVYKSMAQALADTTMKELQSQIIDPFALIFETSATNLTIKDWLEAEAQRQAQKSWMNQVGYFHQEILGSVEGWTDLGFGDESELDLMRDDRSTFAEIKNKHNTMNSSSEREARRKLERVVLNNPTTTAYLVQIVRKRVKPYDEPWTLSGFETNTHIRKISGELFYKIVTGSSTALRDLYNVIPSIMRTIVAENEQLSLGKSIAMLDLIEQSPNETDAEFRKFFLRYVYKNFKDIL